MAYIVENLRKDWFDAVTVDRMIITRQINLEDGVESLHELLRYIRDDIEILDKNTKEILDKKIHELDENTKKEKIRIQSSNPEPRDSIERNTQDFMLLRTDHKRYQDELLFIKHIAFRKGWFD